MTLVALKCPFCGSEHVGKNGFTVLALKRVIIGRVLRDERTLAIILDHY